MVKYTNIYSNSVPDFKDNDIFKVRIPLTEEKRNFKEEVSIEELREIILVFIKKSKGRTRKEINEYVYSVLNNNSKIVNNRIKTTLAYLRKKGHIENSGSSASPIWIFK